MAINLSGDGAGEALGWHLRCGFNQLWFQRKRSLWTGLDHILCEWAALLSPLREQSSLSNSPFLYAAGLPTTPPPSSWSLSPHSRLAFLFIHNLVLHFNTAPPPTHLTTSKTNKKKRVQSLSIPASPTCPKDDPPPPLSLSPFLPSKSLGVFSIFFPVTPPSPQIVSCYRNVAVPCWKITRPIDSVRCDKVFLSLARGTVHKETFLRGSFFFLFSFYNLLAAGLSNTIRLWGL